MQKQTKTYYGPYELTDHLRLQFVVMRSEEHDSQAHAQPPVSHSKRTARAACWVFPSSLDS